MNNRDTSLDVAKGILIALLVLHHIVDVGIRIEHIDILFLNQLFTIQPFIILNFFMPCFFLITGICSNFEIPFSIFLKKQIISLLLPALSFTIIYSLTKNECISKIIINVLGFFYTGGAFWFLLSLFVSKVIFYFLKRIQNKYFLLLILFIISFLGVVANQYLSTYPNVLCYKHSFALLLFLGIGNIFKHHIKQLRNVTTAIILTIVALPIFFIYCFFGLEVPFITLKFSATVCQFPMLIYFATTGSICLISLSKTLTDHLKNPIIEVIQYIGCRTLVIYLTQAEFLLYVISIVHDFFVESNYLISIIIVVVLLISTIIFGLIIDHLLQVTKLSVIIGK